MNTVKKGIRYYVPRPKAPAGIKANLTNRWAFLDLGDTQFIRVGLDSNNNIIVKATKEDDPYAMKYNKKTKGIYIKGLKQLYGVTIPLGEYPVIKIDATTCCILTNPSIGDTVV